MRVRIQRTTSIPSTGEGGLPRKSARGRMQLVVGGGYDLPDTAAKDLIARGLASRVVAVEKPDPLEMREGRRARVAVERVTRGLAAAMGDLAERDAELEEARAEIARLRVEVADLRGELVTVYMIREVASGNFVTELGDEGYATGDVSDGISFASAGEATAAVAGREGLEIAVVEVGGEEKSITDLNAGDARALVADAAPDELDALQAAEEAGGARKGVLEAIEKRRKQLA